MIDRVRSQLIDTAADQRWTDEELLRWLSDGQRSVVAFSAGASSITAVAQLDSGTRQYLPSNAHMLLTIVRNVLPTSDPGRACRIVSREVIDAQDPYWHTATAQTTVYNYIFDPQEPKKFYVYPPNTGAGLVELVYAVLPPELTSLNDPLSVQELYQTALVDYVMFRAHQKDSDFAAGQAVAAQYLQLFLAYMGQGEQSQLQSNPNLQLMPPDAGTRGSAK